MLSLLSLGSVQLQPGVRVELAELVAHGGTTLMISVLSPALFGRGRLADDPASAVPQRYAAPPRVRKQ